MKKFPLDSIKHEIIRITASNFFQNKKYYEKLTPKIIALSQQPTTTRKTPYTFQILIMFPCHLNKFFF